MAVYGHYLIIRFVPDVFRGECVNIGAMIKAPDQDPQIRWTTQLDRAKMLFPKFELIYADLRYVFETDAKLRSIDELVKRYNGDSRIQLTQPRVTLIEEDTLSDVMSHLVEYENVKPTLPG